MGADLNDVSLEYANLSYAKLGKADLRNTDLRGANLGRVDDVTCEQIRSVRIDKNTRLPDHIYLDQSSPSQTHEIFCIYY